MSKLTNFENKYIELRGLAVANNRVITKSLNDKFRNTYPLFTSLVDDDQSIILSTVLMYSNDEYLKYSPNKSIVGLQINVDYELTGRTATIYMIVDNDLIKLRVVDSELEPEVYNDNELYNLYNQYSIYDDNSLIIAVGDIIL